MTQTHEAYEVRLILNRDGDAWRGEWTEPAGQRSNPFAFALPLGAADLLDLRWYLEHYCEFPGAGDHARAEGIAARLDGWGNELFRAIFGSVEGTHVYRSLRDAARKGKQAMVTLGTTDADILGQPWELMRADGGPLVFQGITIRRQLQGAGRARHPQLKLPLRILLAVSRPGDVGFIDPRNSIRPMLDALDGQLAGQATVDLCDPPTLDRLADMARQARRDGKPYHVVHFDGHGTYLPKTGVGALAFERDDGTTHLVTGKELGDLLASLDVPLVMLEACRGSDLSDRPVFGSVAPALLESGVGSVVAFSHSVHVEAARLLVERFYQKLAAGLSVGEALAEARVRLRAEPHRWLHRGPDAETVDLRDWFIPQLYQVGPDPALVVEAGEGDATRPQKLRITINMDWEDYDERAEAILTYGLAGFLKTPARDIAVLTVAEQENGFAVALELPRSAARRLLAAHRDHDSVLAASLRPLSLLDVAEERAAEGRKPFENFPSPPMYRFHGRALELLNLERAFRRHAAVVLTGGGGMGKTALAREAAAWWRRTRRFEAAVFISFEQRAGAERVIQLIGQALGDDKFSARPPDEQWRQAVRLFHTRRVLVVWDNFESTLPIYQRDEEAGLAADGPAGTAAAAGEGMAAAAAGLKGAESVLSFGPEARQRLRELYQALTEENPDGRLLVTCRPAETELPGIKEVALGGLAKPDALHLLAAVLDIKGIATDRVGYEREEIDALLKDLQYHPLSIELIAPHLRELTPRKIRDEFAALLSRFTNDTAVEARNRSLMASLAFSKRRLSKPAQAILPYLAWFRGGVFEGFLLDFAEIEDKAWAAIRTELVATALLAVEDLPGFSTPYLRFHPTLPYAARAADVPDVEEAEKRFIGVYLAATNMADKALRGDQPAAGMAMVQREEANLRSAMVRGFRRGDRREAVYIAQTLGDYLERSGRLRERDALVEWVHGQTVGAGQAGPLDDAACQAICEAALTRLAQGHAEGAVKMVQALIQRLENEGLADRADSTFQLVMAHGYLGRMHIESGRPDLAIEPLGQAIGSFERVPGTGARGNLSAALGAMANALMALGRLGEALDSAERALAIYRELGREREVAAGLGQIAAILVRQGRYAEAEARYQEAFRAAQVAGDLGLQGRILQHQASLQDDMGRYARAVELYKQAMVAFQRAGDAGGEMRTCDLLGSAEAQRSQLDAAEAWYGRARELATRLNDQHQVAATAQNVGILYQTRAEAATDRQVRDGLLRKAIASIEESLGVWIARENQPNAAASHFQLGILYRMLGDVAEAQAHAMEALRVYEPLNLPDVYKDYGNLAEIARARGDEAAARQWQAKCDAKIAELERLARGPAGGRGGPGLPVELLAAIKALAQAAYAARAGAGKLPPDAAEALAQLAAAPPPLGAVGGFLQAVATGASLPPIPTDTPQELKEMLTALVEALKG